MSGALSDFFKNLVGNTEELCFFLVICAAEHKFGSVPTLIAHGEFNTLFLRIQGKSINTFNKQTI